MKILDRLRQWETDLHTFCGYCVKYTENRNRTPTAAPHYSGTAVVLRTLAADRAITWSTASPAYPPRLRPYQREDKP